MVILPQLLWDRQGRATKGSQGLVQVVLLVKHRLQAATGGGRKLILLSKLVCMKVAQLCPTLRPPWTYSPRPEHWSGQTFPSPGNLPNPGIKPRTLTLQADSLPAEPQGKPKNTGVGSLSLLQQIFQTQESHQSPALQMDSLPTELSERHIKHVQLFNRLSEFPGSPVVKILCFHC